MKDDPSEAKSGLHIDPDLLDIWRRDELFAVIRAARPGISEAELRREVFLLCYADEFSPEQQEKFLAANAAYWAREEASEHHLEGA
jgi:hypothetical protein